jgi:hypothetical protein
MLSKLNGTARVVKIAMGRKSRRENRYGFTMVEHIPLKCRFLTEKIVSPGNCKSLVGLFTRRVDRGRGGSEKPLSTQRSSFNMQLGVHLFPLRKRRD